MLRPGTPRLLLLLPTATYRTAAFVEAARRVGVDLTVASERPSTFQDANPGGLVTLDLSDPDRAATEALAFAQEHPLQGSWAWTTTRRSWPPPSPARSACAASASPRRAWRATSTSSGPCSPRRECPCRASRDMAWTTIRGVSPRGCPIRACSSRCAWPRAVG